MPLHILPRDNITHTTTMDNITHTTTIDNIAQYRRWKSLRLPAATHATATWLRPRLETPAPARTFSQLLLPLLHFSQLLLPLLTAL